MDIKDLYDKFRTCSGVTTDSRAVKGGEMFFALRGENFDGNDYALKALRAGASYAVCDREDVPSPEKDPWRLIRTADSLATLQALARYHRENTFVGGSRLKVVGLTGTNGKTTTKELVTRVLSARYNVTSTPGNLNNDIGVPLSLLGIGPRTELAVIEMGASHPDDIEKLVKVCEPDYGLITNVGKAHLLGFGSFEGVKHAKGCLYDWILSHGGRLFLNLDDPVLVEMVRERGIPDEMMVGYGISHSGSIVLPSDAAHPYLRMAVPQEEGSDTLTGIETHLAGAYNANNVAAAIAVGLHFGVPLDDAVQAIEGYVPTNNRSQMEDTGRNTLIVDAYNANPTSMAAALDNLALVQAPLKAAFLGDMRELGADSLAEHETILGKVRSMGLGLVCLVGEEFGKALRDVPGEGIEKWFPTSADLASWLEGNPVEGMTILVKGSRGIQMETVLPKL